MRWTYLVFLTFLFAMDAGGWDDHHRLTRAAIRQLKLNTKTVPYVSLNWALNRKPPGIQSRNAKALREELQLNKTWFFKRKLGERITQDVSVAEILSVYSDEPDWGADQNLFDKDQYPELWKDELIYVTQKKGLGSQGFRHMYFPADFVWRDPLSSIQIPMHPLGEAPSRAQIYFNLAQAMFEVKAPYWGYRFLAWSLHYVQDLFQPFHTRQMPYFGFINFKWKGVFPTIDVAATAEQVAYYHLSFEKFIASEMHKRKDVLMMALVEISKPRLLKTDIETYLKNVVVPFSASFATHAGKESTHAFAPFNPKPGEVAAEFVGTKQWWKGVHKGFYAKRLIEISRDIYRRLGEDTRNTIYSCTLGTQQSLENPL